MLDRIQGLLTALYDVRVDASVQDFVCDEQIARAIVGEAVARGEVLVVLEEPDGASVGLYIEPWALEALQPRDDGTAEPQEADGEADRGFDAYCLATEGVSHFLYLMFRAGNEDPVSQLELELQAEVDKYATGLLAGNGTELVRRLEAARDGGGPRRGPADAFAVDYGQVLWVRSRALRRHLFDRARFRAPAGTPEGDRYRFASRMAAHFAARLERNHLAHGDLREVERKLRRFYRMGVREKVDAARGVGL